MVCSTREADAQDKPVHHRVERPGAHGPGGPGPQVHGPDAPRCRMGMSYGPGSCSWRPRGSTTTRSRPAWTPAARLSPSGASASSPSGSAALRNAHGEDDPRPFPPELVIEVKALACELPSRLGLPLSRLQVSDIRG